AERGPGFGLRVERVDPNALLDVRRGPSALGSTRSTLESASRITPHGTLVIHIQYRGFTSAGALADGLKPLRTPFNAPRPFPRLAFRACSRRGRTWCRPRAVAPAGGRQSGDAPGA